MIELHAILQAWKTMSRIVRAQERADARCYMNQLRMGPQEQPTHLSNVKGDVCSEVRLTCAVTGEKVDANCKEHTVP